jgi:hypothetical protein
MWPGNVGYCPTLPLSAIWHLRPPHVYRLNRSYTKRTDASSIIHSAFDNENQAQSNVVYWTATDLITAAGSKTFCLPVNTFISWEHRYEVVRTLEATQFTNMATGHNRFSVVEERSSHTFCKIAATVSLRERYHELPDLSDKLLYICINIKYKRYSKMFRLTHVAIIRE